jgi:hypothetical protein
MKISNLQSDTYNSILGETTKGFAELKKINNLQYTEVYITKAFEYRPDLLAYYYLGDSNLGWLITCFNGFVNGLSDYTYGKKLKIPSV